MRAMVLVLILSMSVLTSCSSESDPPRSACADIAGNYSITVERVSGTCDPSLDPKTASGSLTKDGEGYLVVLPAVAGGCPATLDASTCKLASACDLKGQDGSVVGTISMSYTFT